jgi:O-antigen ligase
LALLFGFGPFGLIDELYGSLNGARAGSSLARDIIVDESWAAFLRSPWIGYGWVGESVHPTEHLPIGSHSTIYGTLYTGGVLVFTTFALAMAVMIALLGWRLACEKDTQRRKDIEVAMCLALILCISARYEALYSLSLPCFFYFAWIGAAAGRLHPEPARASETKRAREPSRNRAWAPAGGTGRFARAARIKRWAAREAGTDVATRGSTG